MCIGLSLNTFNGFNANMYMYFTSSLQFLYMVVKRCVLEEYNIQTLALAWAFPSALGVSSANGPRP